LRLLLDHATRKLARGLVDHSRPAALCWWTPEQAQTSCFPRSAAFLAGTREEPQGRKTGVAHTSRRSLAGCMRPVERGADMPNYGTSAPPLIFIEFRGPKAQGDRPANHTGLMRYPLLKLELSVVTGIGGVLTNPQPRDRLVVWTAREGLS